MESSFDILSKVGICLSILGLLISITGIGAPLGVPLTTIGNVITVSCLIMDAITMILSGILQGLLIATLKEETDPVKRKALAEKVKKEAANTAAALVSVVMAIPGVGKAVSLGVGKVMALVKKIASMLKLNVILKAVLPLAKKIWGGLKKVLGLADKPKGFIGKVANVGANAMEKFRGWRGALNARIETGLENAAKTKTGSVLGKIGGAGDKTVAALEKYSGKNALTKLENSVDYYAQKGVSTVENKAGKASEKVFGADPKIAPIDTKAQQLAEDEATVKVAKADQALAKAKLDQAAFEKRSKYVEDWESSQGKATTKESQGIANELDDAEKAKKTALNEQDLAGRGTDAQEINRAKTGGKEIAGNKDAIVAKEKKEAEELLKSSKSSDKRVADATKDETAATAKLKQARLDAEAFQKKAGYVKDWESPEGLAVTKESSAVAKKVKDAESAMAKADKEFSGATGEAKQLEEQRLAEEANERAQKRINSARGDKDAWGGGVAPGKVPGGAWDEFKDSMNYKDLGKESISGQIKEIKEVIESATLSKEVGDQTKEKVMEGTKSAPDAAREQAHEAAEHVEAPKLSAVADASDGVKSRVTHLLQDMTPKSKLEDQGGEPGGGAPAEPGANPESPPGQAPAAEPPKATAPDADAPAGTIPYWPELLVSYGSDLTDLGQAEEALKKYKVDQLSGYNAAVGIETSATREKEAATNRKPQVAENVALAGKDAGALTGNSEDNTSVSKEGEKPKAQKDKAAAEGSKGTAAASSPVEDPPKDTSWWGKLKGALNVVKNYILGMLAKGMKYISDAITKCIMSVMGIKPEDVKELSDDTATKGKEGAKEASGAAGATKEAGAEDDGSVTKSGMAVSEAKRLQVETQGNLAAADQLLAAIASLKTDIQKEIEEGKKYIADVNAAYADEKARGMEEAKKQADANKAAQAAGPKKEEQDPAKDEADAGQVARIKEAAHLVMESDVANTQKLQAAFGQGKGLLSSGPNAGKNPQAVSQAISVFDGSQDSVAHFQEGVSKRGATLGGIIGKDKISAGELVDQVTKIESSAADSDDGYQHAVQELEADFSACYLHANKPPAVAAPAPGAAPA